MAREHCDGFLYGPLTPSFYLHLKMAFDCIWKAILGLLIYNFGFASFPQIEYYLFFGIVFFCRPPSLSSSLSATGFVLKVLSSIDEFICSLMIWTPFTARYFWRYASFETSRWRRKLNWKDDDDDDTALCTNRSKERTWRSDSALMMAVSLILRVGEK